MASIGQALSSVGSHLAALLATRFELFGLEALNARDRLLQRLALLLAAALCLFLALLLITLTITLLFWATPWRYWALVVMALLYLVVGLGLILMLLHKMRHDPSPFAATTAVLHADMHALSGVRQRSGEPAHSARKATEAGPDA